jgi:hypothetical protein
MSNEPGKRYKDAKESVESSIQERPEPPIDKPDPREPVKSRWNQGRKRSRYKAIRQYF